MSRALVLGGGGPVGIGWEAGLLVGLKAAGVDPSLADAVVGTSAGSVVGFTLASGGDLTQAVQLLRAEGGAASEAAPAATPGAPDAEAAQGLEVLMASVADAAEHPDAAEDIRAALGALALAAPTISEERWLSLFATFEGQAWADGFSCTAVDAEDGRFQVWDRSSDVDPQHAIASSCAVPLLFPPVAIGGARYMDGGVRDILNADLAAGHDRVIVVSCTLLELPVGLLNPVMDLVFGATLHRIEALRAAGAAVEVIVPNDEMLEISGWGLHLMDFSRAPAAYDAGLKQATQEAGRLSAWAAAGQRT